MWPLAWAGGVKGVVCVAIPAVTLLMTFRFISPNFLSTHRFQMFSEHLSPSLSNKALIEALL